MTTYTYDAAGGDQTYSTPASGVVAVRITCEGAGSSLSGGGAKGGKSVGVYRVTPGQQLFMRFLNGQVGGGGWSADVRVGGTALGNRLIVAGGAGFDWDTSTRGGAGGGTSGANGQGPSGGAGATQSSGSTDGLGTTGFSNVWGGSGYRGGAGPSNTNSGGGGGSGYLSPLLEPGATTTQGGSQFDTYNQARVTIEEIPNTAPNAPLLVSPVGGAKAARDAAIVLTWQFSDSGPSWDHQSAYQVRYRLVGAGSWTTVSKTTSTASQHSLVANLLAAGDYEWQALTYDSYDAAGPWSASGFFTARNAPAAPTVTAPANNATLTGPLVDVTWTTSEQEAYQIQRLGDSAGSPDPSVVYYDSGTIEDADARTQRLVFETNSRIEHVRMRIRADGLWSAWSTDHKVTVSWTPPPAASYSLTVDEDEDAIVVAITNPTSTGLQPPTDHNDVYVDDGQGAGWVRKVTGVPPDSSWTYRTPRALRDYDTGIKVVAVGNNGSTNETTVPS